MKKLNYTLLAFLAAWSIAGSAQIQVNQEPLIFNSVEQEERFNRLTAELRCLVCQNQNLADSDAPLAHDLREEIHDMMLAGRTDEEIKNFLVERYGDFVLYKPPVKGNTVVLWAAPILLLLMGGVIIAVIVKRQSAMVASPDGENE